MTFCFYVGYGHTRNKNNLSHPNRCLWNFVLRNKKKKKGRPSGGDSRVPWQLTQQSSIRVW